MGTWGEVERIVQPTDLIRQVGFRVSREAREPHEEIRMQSTTKPWVSTTKPWVATTKPWLSTTKPWLSTTKPWFDATPRS